MIKDDINKNNSIILSIDKNEINFSLEYVKYRISEDNKLVILDLKELPSDEYDKNIYLRIQYMPFYTDDDTGYDEKSESNETDSSKNTMEVALSFVRIGQDIKNLSEAYMKMDLSDEECEHALSREYAIMASVVYSNFAIEEYQMHLKILALLSPQSDMVIDLQSFSIRSGSWLRHTLNFALPPSLSYLFTVHSVYDDDKDEHEYWFHTHGLNRLGLPEIEIMGVNDDEIAYGLSNLISAVAKFVIENGVPEELFDGKIQLAYDIPTKMLLFTEAQEHFDKDILGMSDRDDDSDMHSVDSVVIVPLQNGEIVKFESYEDKLGDNAIFALSNFETMLMKEAARTTVGHFLDVFEQYKNNSDFNFIIKLQYFDLKTNDSEHLWFEVHDFSKEELTFDATLMNIPYYNIGLSEGERGDYDLSRLTDWSIHIEDYKYNYNSANIYMLFGE